MDRPLLMQPSWKIQIYEKSMLSGSEPLLQLQNEDIRFIDSDGGEVHEHAAELSRLSMPFFHWPSLMDTTNRF